MLSDSAIVRPTAPPFYGADENATTEHGSGDNEEQEIYPIIAVPWHL
jgi:hypothetical protein